MYRSHKKVNLTAQLPFINIVEIVNGPVPWIIASTPILFKPRGIPLIEVLVSKISLPYELHQLLGFAATFRGHDDPVTTLRRRPPPRLAGGNNNPAVPAPAQASQAICLHNAGVNVQDDRRRSLPNSKTSRAARVPTHVHQELTIRFIPGMKQQLSHNCVIHTLPIYA